MKPSFIEPGPASPSRDAIPSPARMFVQPCFPREPSWLASIFGPFPFCTWILNFFSRFLVWRPAALGYVPPAASQPTWHDFIDFETFVFDCDGVIWGIDPADTPTAVATINYLIENGKRVLFVTNNSNKHRADFCRELESRGVDFKGRSETERVAMVISASYTTAQYLNEHGFKRPFVITSDTGILEELKLVGIQDYYATVDDRGNTQPEFVSIMQHGTQFEIPSIISAHPDVDCIVVGWDKGLTARKIGTAVNYIRFHEDVNKSKDGFKPLPIIACSGDASGCFGTATYKGVNVKFRAVGNGAMADAIAGCFDPRKDWLDMGKPSMALMEILRSPLSYNVDVSKALMIGDTLQTDIVFGNRGGMKTLLVLSGVTTQSELEETVASGARDRVPTYALPKVGFWAEQGPLPPA